MSFRNMSAQELIKHLEFDRFQEAAGCIAQPMGNYPGLVKLSFGAGGCGCISICYMRDSSIL